MDFHDISRKKTVNGQERQQTPIDRAIGEQSGGGETSQVQSKQGYGDRGEQDESGRAESGEQPAQIEGKSQGRQPREKQEIPLVGRLAPNKVRREGIEQTAIFAEPDPVGIALPPAPLAQERINGFRHVRVTNGALGENDLEAGEPEPDGEIQVLAAARVHAADQLPRAAAKGAEGA